MRNAPGPPKVSWPQPAPPHSATVAFATPGGNVKLAYAPVGEKDAFPHDGGTPVALADGERLGDVDGDAPPPVREAVAVGEREADGVLVAHALRVGVTVGDCVADGVADTPEPTAMLRTTRLLASAT